jgi:hypothetical protein
MIAGNPKQPVGMRWHSMCGHQAEQAWNDRSQVQPDQTNSALLSQLFSSRFARMVLTSDDHGRLDRTVVRRDRDAVHAAIRREALILPMA